MKVGSSTSIRACLLKLSQNEGLVFQQVVTRYLHERLLYRLSLSEYKYKFILKGGNLLYALEGLHVRPTVDIDILAKNIENDKEILKKIFTDICNIHYDNDCVYFDTSNIVVSDIAEEKKYSGIRLLIKAQFNTIKQYLQVDIGFGDIVFPAPIIISYPTLLNELSPPDIMAYSIETLIAEKFHAMTQLGLFNSRYKDFYDVYKLFLQNEINEQALTEAIKVTFRQRETKFSTNHPLFSDVFAKDPDRNLQWHYFLKKIKHSETLTFETVMSLIKSKLQPIIENESNVI